MTGVDLGLGFAVTPENVLDAYAVIEGEHRRLQSALANFQASALSGMRLCGGDPVSKDAAAGFTAAAQQLATRCQKDIDRIGSIATSLANTAHTYAMSDEQISASLKAIEPYTPEPIIPVGNELHPGERVVRLGGLT